MHAPVQSPEHAVVILKNNLSKVYKCYFWEDMLEDHSFIPEMELALFTYFT